MRLARVGRHQGVRENCLHPRPPIRALRLIGGEDAGAQPQGDDRLGVGDSGAPTLQLRLKRGRKLCEPEGAALSAAFRIAATDAYAGKQIVAIIPSFAERYLSTVLFEGI